jgi:hypothetical protein
MMPPTLFVKQALASAEITVGLKRRFEMLSIEKDDVLFNEAWKKDKKIRSLSSSNEIPDSRTFQTEEYLRPKDMFAKIVTYELILNPDQTRQKSSMNESRFGELLYRYDANKEG